MKSEELMVGDYLTFPDVQNDSNCPKLRVIAVNEEDVYVSVDGDPVADLCDPKELAGIPLTPEILEKNGFVMDKEEKTHGITYHILIPTGYEANSYTIQITLYKEPICGVSVLLKIWGWIPPYDGGINDIHLCGAKYIHELQHALRMCGINKTIEL